MNKSFKAQIAFALTTSGSDGYFAMAQIAARSVRLSNPQANISIFIDKESLDNVSSADMSKLMDIGKVCEIDTPSGSPSFRNRWVKTTLHRKIVGPFLYLDVDTLCRKTIAPLFLQFWGDAFAGARNHSASDFEGQIWKDDIDVFSKMNWPTSGNVYFNGGVLFFGAHHKGREIAEEWHRAFIESYSITGRARDQPALNHAAYQSIEFCKILPDCYNAQIKINPGCAVGSAIVHYYSSCKGVLTTEFELVAQESIRNMNINEKRLHKLMRKRHPYRSRYLGDDSLGERIVSRGFMTNEDVEWYKVSPIRFFLNLVRRQFRSFK